MDRSDISRGLISVADIRNNLLTIFPDAIIVNDQFSIVGASDSVSTMLGYVQGELSGKDFYVLSTDPLLQDLYRELKKGVFKDLVMELKGKDNRSQRYKVCGFYLGLISDINGVIILQLKPVDQARILNHQLEASRKELDEFVYRSTHDLRGPLATMRGLINIMKLEGEQLTPEMKSIVTMLDTHAQILDDRLFQLNYLAETASAEPGDASLDCEKLESTMRSTIEENMTINSIDFQFNTFQRIIQGISARPVTSMLNHVLLYLINLPRGSESKLSFSVEHSSSGLQIVVYAEGFLSNYQLRQAVQRNDSLFTTLIAYADLINFFAAMKTAQRIHARIQVDFIFEMRQQITVSIPWNS